MDVTLDLASLHARAARRAVSAGKKTVGRNSRRLSSLRLVRLVIALSLAGLSLAGALTTGGCLLGPRAVTVTDDAGRVLTLDRAPERIVSMAPSNTEILFALGLGDRVVGVTTYCNYPPEAAAVEKVGDAYSPDYEKIVSLRPDLVVAVGTADSDLVKGLEGYGLKVLVLQAATVDQVASDILLVGKVCRADKAAEKLAAKLQQRLAAVKERLAAVSAAPRPTVFWCLDRGLWTVGPKSFVSDIIKLAGGQNIGDSLGMAYGQFSLETLLQTDPDVIIIPVLDQSVPAELAKLPGWSTLKAVREGRVYQIDPDIVSRPGPRVADAVEQVAALLHPDVFGGGSK